VKLLIKGGQIYNFDNAFLGDVLIEDGLIKEVSPKIESQDHCEIYNAEGKMVFPGFIDVHTHPGLPEDLGYKKDTDDFITETRAARKGGTTTIIDFAEQHLEETLTQALAQRERRYEKKAQCRYAFHIAVTKLRADIYEQLVEVKKRGVNSVKVYTTYGMMLGSKDILILMECCAALDMVMMVHCEDNDIINYCSKRMLYWESRPREAETAMVYKIVSLAALTGCKVCICHVSCAESVDIIEAAKKKGLLVYLETCPQYLLLTEEKYKGEPIEAAKFFLSPPLRKEEDCIRLTEACQKGVVDFISTDHCAFLFEKHKKPFVEERERVAKGIPGIEVRVSLMYDYLVLKNHMDPKAFVKIMSYNEAHVFKLPYRGYIKEGNFADLVIMSEDKDVIRSGKLIGSSDYTPYEGMGIGCRIIKVI